VIRVARLADSDEVQQELNLYNRLLPGQGLLQAALLIEIADMSEFVKNWRPGRISAANSSSCASSRCVSRRTW